MLSKGTICLSAFNKMKFENFVEFWDKPICTLPRVFPCTSIITFSTTMPLLRQRIFFDLNTFIGFSSSMPQILATFFPKESGKVGRVTRKEDNWKKKILNEDTQIWNNSFGRGFKYNCSWNTVVTIDKQITFFFSVFQKNWSHDFVSFNSDLQCFRGWKFKIDV